jgi:hypothetical protein
MEIVNVVLMRRFMTCGRYCSLVNVREMKTNKGRYVDGMCGTHEGMINSYKIVIEKSKWKRPP